LLEDPPPPDHPFGQSQWWFHFLTKTGPCPAFAQGLVGHHRETGQHPLQFVEVSLVIGHVEGGIHLDQGRPRGGLDGKCGGVNPIGVEICPNAGDQELAGVRFVFAAEDRRDPGDRPAAALALPARACGASSSIDVKSVKEPPR